MKRSHNRAPCIGLTVQRRLTVFKMARARSIRITIRMKNDEGWVSVNSAAAPAAAPDGVSLATFIVTSPSAT